MEYSEEFQEAVKFCEKENLFLGYGNPNGKILMIGKEQYFDSTSDNDTDEFYNELLEKRNEVNQDNINSWLKNLENKFIPDWNSLKNPIEINSNAQTIYWNQRNTMNKLLKNGDWNCGTSSTYLQYQKIYQNMFMDSVKQENIEFQKEFFITELNDLVAKKDYNFTRLKKIKQEFISKREVLFNLKFFKSFPIIIIASGHYSKQFNFNIEKTFDVVWTKETLFVGKSWVNLHYSTNSDKKRLLIHTRQLSTSVTNELIKELSDIIKRFLGDL